MNKIFRSLMVTVAAVASLVVVAGFTASPVVAQSYYGDTGTPIRNIKVIGTQRIEPATVVTYLEVHQGDVVDQDTMDRALKSLFATGLFSDVRLYQRGSTLEVNVAENPVINEIAIEGNQRIKDEELMAELQLHERQVFTRTKVQEDVNRLYQVYRRNGRFSVQIEPKIIELDQNRVNLVFEVTEGSVTKVDSIRFVGNTHFSDDALRSEVTTKEGRWYRFLTTDDRYDPDRVSYDQELLRRFYLSKGYADFRVVSATSELSKDKESFYLTFTVEEGERYRIGKVSLNSALRNFDANVLKSDVTVSAGDWYNADEVQNTVDKITADLGNRQYAFVSVRPDIQRNREAKTVDLVFQINETPKVFVERIDIDGNVRTLDKVIRREMTLVEGDPFNKSKLAKAEQNIKDLGFFENVTVTPLQGSAPDKTVLDVSVAEQSTGELSVGGGYSTSDGPLADFGIREHNLLGRGQDLALSATVAGKRTEFDLSFTEPYFLDRDFSAGIDAFHITRDLQNESSYDQKRTGGGLRFGYPLSEKWRQGLGYRLEQNEIYNVQSDASRFVRDQSGTRLTSAVSQRLTYDARNSTLFPTDGLYSWLDAEVAGLGGDAKYVSGKLGSSWYYPVAERWTLNLLGEGGAIQGLSSEDVKINERYFLGGTTLRGFSRGGVGPRDTTTNDSLGGNLFYRGTAEMSFPVGLPEEMGVAGHAFTDVGSLWSLDEISSPSIVDESSLRASAGLGVSWKSPIGPVRADFSIPYLKEDFDDKQPFQFNFGTRF